MSNIDQSRGHRQVFGAVASDPTVSRLVRTLAADPAQAWRPITATPVLIRWSSTSTRLW